MLQAKLLNQDMIARGVVYHRNCLTNMYKNANAAQLDRNYSDSKRQLYGIAFSEVVTYIEEITMYLSDLSKIYCQCLKEFGMEVQARIRSSRLENQILNELLC